MRHGTASSIAQTIARVWLLAAVAAFALPERDRLGWWLPVHLALAGAASTAIAGAAPDFAASLSAGRVVRWAWVPLVLLSLGAAAIAVGVPTATDALTAVGGTSFALGGAVLAAAVFRSWRSGINRRHAAIVRLYVFAALCPVVGALFGILMGAGAISAPATFLAIRRAHVAANLAGFLNLTIVATSVLLVPTVLRVRSPRWPLGTASVALALGVTTAVAGSAVAARWLAVIGTALYAIGAVTVFAGALAAVRTAMHPVRAASFHLVAALAWLAVGATGWTSLLATGASDRALAGVAVAFAVGTVVQALIGAWSYLVPMSVAGGPEVHRRLLARADVGALGQAVTFNIGVFVTAASITIGRAPRATTFGAVLVIMAAATAVWKVQAPRRARSRSDPGGSIGPASA